MKYLKGIGILLIVLVVAYLVGPSPDSITVDNYPISLQIQLSELSDFVKRKEDNTPYLKPGNNAQIVWADSNHTITPYALVYIHGFSASPEEGAPIHKEIADRYGMNLYLARIAGHGTNEPEPFKELSVEKMMHSAKEAVAIGKLLGKKVILMSCSTGGTFSLYLASNDPDIDGLVMYSPNIDLYDQKSDILTVPWGLQVARLIAGGEQRSFEATDEVKKYWTTTYRIEGLVALKQLLRETMTIKTFEKVKQPAFVGYFHKNEQEQDKVISVKKIKRMLEVLGTPEEDRSVVAFTEVGSHAINSRHYSMDLNSVRVETINFLEEVMGLTPKSSD
jgi:esterase/lipase